MYCPLLLIVLNAMTKELLIDIDNDNGISRTIPIITLLLAGQNIQRGQQEVATQRPSIVSLQHRERRRRDHQLLLLLHQIETILISCKKKIMKITTKYTMMMMAMNRGRKGIGTWSCLLVVVARPRWSQSELNRNIHQKFPTHIVLNIAIVVKYSPILPCMLMIRTIVLNATKTIPMTMTTVMTKTTTAAIMMMMMMNQRN